MSSCGCSGDDKKDVKPSSTGCCGGSQPMPAQGQLVGTDSLTHGSHTDQNGVKVDLPVVKK